MDALAEHHKDNVPNAKKRWAVRNFENKQYEPNPECWARYMNLSCCVVGSSVGFAKTGTLITPSCIMMAAHYRFAFGTLVHFVGQNGEVFERTVVKSKVHYLYKGKESGYYPDLCVAALNEPLPEMCTPAKLLPSDWQNFLPEEGNGLPALSLDKDDHCTIREFRSISSPQMATFRKPLDETRALYYEDLIGGDSSDPGLLIGYSAPVLTAVWTFGGWGSGTSITYFANNLGSRNWIDATCYELAGEKPQRQRLYK